MITAASVYGVWYDLPAATGQLRASAPSAYLEAIEVELQEGGIERVLGEMEPVEPFLP